MKKWRQSGLPQVTRQISGTHQEYKPRSPDILRSTSNRCQELRELKGLETEFGILCSASPLQNALSLLPYNVVPHFEDSCLPDAPT